MSIESATERDNFFDDNDFADEATFTDPALGAVNGIFDNETELMDADESGVLISVPMFYCNTTNVTGVQEGSTLTLAAIDYVVKERYNDGTGVTTLRLELA